MKIVYRYFDIEARGEIIRLIFTLGGVDFVDERIKFEDWPALKLSGQCPFDQLPLLVVDGRTISQSGAIARFAARVAGLAGKTGLEQALADQAADYLMHDLFEPIVTFKFLEKDESRKAEKQKQYIEETIPAGLQRLERLLISNGGQYFTGHLTYADVALYRFAGLVKEWYDLPAQASKFPGLVDLYKRISNEKNIKAYEDKKNTVVSM